jgi:hypothetical protein
MFGRQGKYTKENLHCNIKHTVTIQLKNKNGVCLDKSHVKMKYFSHYQMRKIISFPYIFVCAGE